jgi:hypothetical protein
VVVSGTVVVVVVEVVVDGPFTSGALAGAARGRVLTAACDLPPCWVAQ